MHLMHPSLESVSTYKGGFVATVALRHLRNLTPKYIYRRSPFFFVGGLSRCLDKNFCSIFWRRSLSKVSHSQMTRQSQPASLRAFREAASRSTLRTNLACQYSALVLGLVVREQPGCRCQKQPCTKTILQSLGKTRSGLPSKSLRWMRNLNPSLCAVDLTNSSGLVFFALTLAIRADRAGGTRAGLQDCLDLNFIKRDRGQVEPKASVTGT